MSPLPTLLLQTLSTTTALVAAGGIATLSAFDLPILRSQPASRSLPSARWLFSRGSHVFPTAAVVSAAGFCALAVLSLGPARGVGQVVRLVLSGRNARVTGYVLAAALSASIGPFTGLVMVPTNFEIIGLNARLGGKRSAAAAGSGGVESEDVGKGGEAVKSVEGVGEGDEFTDLSGPQTEARRDGSKEDEERAQVLLKRFEALNAVRAVLIGAGGVVGLVTTLL